MEPLQRPIFAACGVRNTLTRGRRYGNGGPLDSVDVRILRELLQGQAAAPMNSQFRKSYESVAKQVGVDERTARTRGKGYPRRGFITDERPVLTPTLLRAGEIV